LSLICLITILADRTAHSVIGYWHDTVVCPSVCLFVTLWIVAKWYVLHYSKSVWTSE